MPRPASTLWSHFRKDASQKRAICNYCQHNMCGLVTRMRTHLARKCRNCPSDVKQEMFDTELNRKLELSVVHGHAECNTSSNLNSTKVKGRRERMDGSMVVKDDLDTCIGKAILGAGLPVHILDNPAFIKLIKRIHPGLPIPSAYSLATSGLELEYTETQLKLRAEVLDAPFICLGIESWSLLYNRSVISCMIYTPKPGMFSFENTGELPHTPPILMEKIENIITQIGSEKVSVIVTDMQPNMLKSVELLARKYPRITFLPSCYHGMHAMILEILQLPSYATIVNSCKEISKFFTQNHIAKAAYARVVDQMQVIQSSVLIVEMNTECPLSILESMESIERSRHIFDIMFAEAGYPDALDASMREQISSLGFWEELSALTGLFDPLLQLLRTFESDYPLLSTFYHRITALWGHLEKYGKMANGIRVVVSKHWQSIRHPAMYTAYLLDPRFPPSNLSAEATTEVLTYLKELLIDTDSFANIVSELTRFTGRVGMFADEAIWESAQKCSPVHWWKGFIGGSCPSLQAVALRTLCFPATSGLSKSKREMFEKIHDMNSKLLNEDQANKAALVHLNTQFSHASETCLTNQTLV